MWYIESKTLWPFSENFETHHDTSGMAFTSPPGPEVNLTKEDQIMERKIALQEFKKMWTWLYKHPAHDGKYYVQHVAKANPAWRNECPLCALAKEGECQECKSLWDTGHGSLCSDPESPLRQWRKTAASDPDLRTWYAGKLIDIAGRALK